MEDSGDGSILRIAICDDDNADRERVRGLVDEYLKEKTVPAKVRVFGHPDDLIEGCARFLPHIYVLDIVMPMLSGIQAARELKWNQPEAEIIFATSESSYALESFDVNPVNYILKPIDREKLFSTLDLALSRVDLGTGRTVTVKVKGGFRTLRCEEILYIEYRNHVVTYHMLSGETVSPPTLRIGFGEYMENNHDDRAFVRCHESIAVNIGAVDKLKKTEITLRNNEVLPVSKSRYQEVLDAYMDYRF